MLFTRRNNYRLVPLTFFSKTAMNVLIGNNYGLLSGNNIFQIREIGIEKIADFVFGKRVIELFHELVMKPGNLILKDGIIVAMSPLRGSLLVLYDFMILFW